MRKLGVAVFGCGWISPAHISAYRELAGECDVVDVFEPREEAARARAARFRVPLVHTVYERLLGDARIQLLSVGTWLLLHPAIEVEDLAYGLVCFANGVIGKVLATSCCEWPREHGNDAGLRLIGEGGMIHGAEPWLYSLDFSLNDERAETALRADFERV